MKTIIIGAGELGQMLAAKLCTESNDVTVIDSSEADFRRIQERLDVLTIRGEATDVEAMKQAGANHADYLLAVCGDQASNMLACQIAKHLGTHRTVCRIYTPNLFSEADGVTPEFFGIGDVISSPAECVKHILYVLRRQIVLEHALFSNPDATIVTALVTEDSPLNGMELAAIPDKELVASIRIAAILRNRKLKIPHGDTVINAGDQIYLAGHQDNVYRFIDYMTGHSEKRKFIIIGGATLLGKMIGDSLKGMNVDIRYVEPSREAGEELLSNLQVSTQVICGETTDKDSLIEAGIDGCSIFIATGEEDEDNILSCILAKRLGARKTVTVTHKPEYTGIIPAMDYIDCGFNSTVISANAIFSLMKRDSFRIDTRLLICQAYFKEYTVTKSSRIVGQMICNCKLPKSAILAMYFRGSNVMTPSGTTQLEPGDTVVAIVTKETDLQLQPWF